MDQTLRDELRKQVNALGMAVADLDSALRQKHEIDRYQALFQKVTDERNTLDALLHDRRSSTLSEFFSAVGAGVLRAQERLDESAVTEVERRLAAEERAGGEREDEDIYDDPPAAGAAGLPIGPPTLFRIPRVTAEIKYSLETLQGKEVQLIFYSKESQAKEMHQQRVEFEVVATPVPVDYLQALRDSRARGGARAARPLGQAQRAPDARGAERIGLEAAEDRSGLESEVIPAADPWTAFLATPVERSSAVVRLRTEAARGKGKRRPTIPAKLVPHLSQVLVLRDARDGEARRLYAILALAGKRRALSVWEITPGTGEVVPLFELPASGAVRERLDRARRCLARLGAAVAARQA